MFQWNNILIAEIVVVVVALFVLGLVKLPRFFRRRKLAKGSPWGYYADQVPRSTPGHFSRDNENLLHDAGVGFTGIPGYGDYGQFTGFGEMGEFGQDFASGHDSSSGHE